MKFRCRSCKHLSERNECRRLPPAFNVAIGRAFPVVRDDDWCGEHKLERKPRAEPALPRKRAWPGERPEEAAHREALIAGEYDGGLSNNSRKATVVLGLLECLGDALGDPGRVAWTKGNVEPFVEALGARMSASYLAKACYGWTNDPSGWWTGKLEGEQPKVPTPRLVVKHAIKFHRWYEDQAPSTERPDWLDEVKA